MTVRRTLIATSLAAAAAITLPFGARAQSMTLKAADVHPAGYPNVVAIEHMGQKLEAATGGRIKLKMFASGVLGGEKEMIEQTQVGAIAHPAHLARPGGPGGPRCQRLQHAVRVPQRGTHARGDRRPDRRRNARQDHRFAGQAGRTRLDGRRHAQPLHQEAGALDRRSQGTEDPHDRATRCSSTP